MGFADNGTKVVAAIAVCAILILSILIPFVSNAGTVEKRFDVANEGTPLIQGDVSQDYNIQWDSALPGMVKINPKQLTVTFSAGQDATVSPASKTVAAGLTYGELPIPVRTGYTFGGWFTSTAYTTEVTEETIVGNTNVILYAKWTANTYTVTFDADGGTVSPATKTVTFGSAYGELPVPEYTGYNFGGWFDEDDNPITAATIVSIADDHTLTAKWTAEQYLISFTTDGKGTVDVASLTADYDTPYTISGNTVTIGSTVVTATPDGFYVFDHWTPSSSGTISGAMTFIANFNLPPVTLSFSAQSPGSVDTQTVADVPRGTQYTVLDNTVVLNTDPAVTVTASLPDGYYMIGWNIGQGTGTVTDAMTFTASYEAIEIAKVVCSTNTTWIITEDGKLFGCGSGANGKQGSGNTNNVTTFTQRLENETVATVSCSNQTTWVVTTDGKLFGCGENDYGQQGANFGTPALSFTQRLTNETIADVVCSDGTTWAVTTDGKLFGCGKNQFGQQGSGNQSNVITFTQRLSGETIASVVCSDQTTWVVTTDGKLFGCGMNASNNQSVTGTNSVTTFTQRLDTETVATVSCSNSTTWVVTTDGKLFGCGANNSGQQGDDTTTTVTTFTQRLSGETIASVVCSDNTTWAVTTDGKLFGCGANNSGQQGDGTTTSVKTFTQRLTDQTIESFKPTSSTTWAVTTDGKLYGCGNNEYGQQGNGTSGYTGVKTLTQRLSTETIADVVCSTNTTWVLTTDGKLYGCGNNGGGQQGDGTTTNVKTFTQKPTGSVYIKVAATFSAQSPGSVDTAQINVPVGTQYTVLDNTITFEGVGTVTASLPNGYYMTGWNVAQGTGTMTEAMTFTAEYEMIEIAEVSCTQDTTFIVTADGKLFSCGYNYWGNQGDGTHSSNQAIDTFTQRLENENVAHVYCTDYTTWAVTTDGKLFGCGYNSQGQQGTNTPYNIDTFTQRLTDQTIKSVSCSTEITWAVTTDGKLFGCGANNYGQQGDGTTTKVTTFTQRLSSETIADVICSTNTTWAVTTDGKLFGCGAGGSGQQGDGTKTNVTSFTQRLDTETIASVSCSGQNTWAVTTDGKLFGCGANNVGQMGNGTSGSGTEITTFTQCLNTEIISHVRVTSGTTWAVTTDSKLFSCGYNASGQQGDGTTTNVTTFTQRLSSETIADVILGGDTVWAITTDGKLFGCGSGGSGQQGSGSTPTSVKTFTQRLENENVMKISASEKTTWVITTDGKLFGCGDNRFGQQGNGTSGTSTNVKTFTQRGPALVNIPAQISPQMQTLNVSRLSPAPILLLNSVSPANIVGTDYTFHAGGTGWLLCTVSVGQDQYALALFSSDLQSPLLWDEDAALMFSNGTMTCENDGVTYTMTYTDIYFEGNGGYVLTTGTANVKDDTNIIAFSVPSPGDAVQVTGTLDDLTAAVLSGSSSAGAVTATSEDTDYEEIKNVTEISAEYGSDTAVCSSIIVPNKVSVVREVNDEVMGTLLSIVPMVTIVGLILAVLGTFMFKRQ